MGHFQFDVAGYNTDPAVISLNSALFVFFLYFFDRSPYQVCINRK